MISKTFRIAGMIVLVSFALSSAARATCSDASLSGTYGFLHDSTDSNGTPLTAAVTQITFDSTTGTFTGEMTASHDGVIVTESLTGTYAIASNCIGTGTPAGGAPFTIVVTSTGFLALHLFAEGFAVKQGSPTCTNAGVQGNFGFETTGVFLAAPTPAVAFIGELKLRVKPSGEGVISGHVSASEDGTFISEEPVTGSYTVATDCTGTLTVTPKGGSPLNFSFVMVDCGKEMLAVETDADTVVSGTLLKDDTVSSTGALRDREDGGEKCGGSHPSGAVRLPQGAEFATEGEERWSEHERGALGGWLKPADIAHFQKLIVPFVAECDACKPFPDLSINRRQTLDESVADLGGLTAACDANRASLLAPATNSLS